jgi:hypothetical protein
MVFSNGYTVPLSAATADTRAALLPTSHPTAAASANPDALAGGMALQSTTPTLSQPTPTGPSKGLFIGIGVGSAVAAVVAGALLGHRGGDLYLKAGWRFEMVLADPLSLDAAKVAAAMANTNANPPQ